MYGKGLSSFLSVSRCISVRLCILDTALERKPAACEPTPHLVFRADRTSRPVIVFLFAVLPTATTAAQTFFFFKVLCLLHFAETHMKVKWVGEHL